MWRRRQFFESFCMLTPLRTKACHPVRLACRVDVREGRGRLPNLAAAGGNRPRQPDSKGSWRNWQTRKVEGLVPARACWFDSSRAHLVEGRAPTRSTRISRGPSRLSEVNRWLIETEARCQQMASLFFLRSRGAGLFFALMRRSSNVRQRLTIPQSPSTFSANRGDPRHAKYRGARRHQ